MFSNFKTACWHCRRMFMLAGCLSILGYWLSPDSPSGRYWVASLWMFMTPLLWAGRYSAVEYQNRIRYVLLSAKRSKVHCIELVMMFVLTLFVAAGVCRGVGLSCFAVGLWGAVLCGWTSLLDQLGRRVSSTLISVTCGGLLVWSCPFWLGGWLGEPGFSPWLASWIMWLHPVSQALTFSGASNLIEPVFYSLTFIGVVEVELFRPIWGLLLAFAMTIALFWCSYILNRNRSAS